MTVCGLLVNVERRCNLQDLQHEQPVDQHAGHRARRHRQHATHGDHRQPQGTTSTAHLLLTQQSLALVRIQTGTFF